MKPPNRSPFKKGTPQLPAQVVLAGRSLTGDAWVDDARAKTLTLGHKDSTRSALSIYAGNANPDLISLYDTSAVEIAAVLGTGTFHNTGGYAQYSALADTEPLLRLASDTLSFGAGGASATDVALGRVAAAIIRIGTALAGNALELREMTAPTGAANTARFFAQDNGAGKTQLVVIFGSGAAQVIATEP